MDDRFLHPFDYLKKKYIESQSVSIEISRVTIQII